MRATWEGYGIVKEGFIWSMRIQEEVMSGVSNNHRRPVMAIMVKRSWAGGSPHCKIWKTVWLLSSYRQKWDTVIYDCIVGSGKQGERDSLGPAPVHYVGSCHFRGRKKKNKSQSWPFFLFPFFFHSSFLWSITRTKKASCSKHHKATPSSLAVNVPLGKMSAQAMVRRWLKRILMTFSPLCNFGTRDTHPSLCL